MSANRTNVDQFQLRLPPGLRDRIKAAADMNGRSTNAEIISTLEDAYPDLAHFRDELRIIDEIDEIQQRLDRVKAARIAEVSESYSQQFLDERAAKRAEQRKEIGKALKNKDEG